jgi:hypothetical protein
MPGLGGTVKFLAVNERAAIVHRYDVVRRACGAGAIGDNFVLQAVRQGDDTGLGFVCSQKRFAVPFVFLRNFLPHFFLFGGNESFWNWFNVLPISCSVIKVGPPA